MDNPFDGIDDISEFDKALDTKKTGSDDLSGSKDESEILGLEKASETSVEATPVDNTPISRKTVTKNYTEKMIEKHGEPGNWPAQ